MTKPSCNYTKMATVQGRHGPARVQLRVTGSGLHSSKAPTQQKGREAGRIGDSGPGWPTLSCDERAPHFVGGTKTSPLDQNTLCCLGTSVQNPIQSNQARESHESIEIGKKEVKPPLFTDDMLFCVENTPDSKSLSTNKVILSDCKIEVKHTKPILCLCTHNEQSTVEIKKAITFIISSKWSKTPTKS